MVIPPGFEPGLLPWKSSVLTSWLRDHIQDTIKIFYTKNLLSKILLYVPLWSLVSLGRFELPAHWLKVSCVTSYATGSDILDGCFAANKHYHRLEEWILLRQCSTLHENLMLTGKWVVYLCATSMHSSHYWRWMAHLVFPQIFWFSFLQLLPIRESKPNSLLEPPITNRNAVIFIG